MNWLTDETTPTIVTIEELDAFTGDEFLAERPRRVDVKTRTTVVPLLVIRRQAADRVIILNNGAMDLSRSQGNPIFQRSSWWEEIDAHQIYVCDPGTLGPHALSLNWFQSPPPEWTNSHVTTAIRMIASRLGVRKSSKRTYYGSSAGGFAALLQLCTDKNARCIVNNAQFDWTRWYANYVTPVLKKHFDGALAAEVRKRWPHRANALVYLSRSPKPLNIEYHVNMASGYDRDIQLPLFETFLSEYPMICGAVSVHRYFDEPQGHNPLGKNETLRILNQNSKWSGID